MDISSENQDSNSSSAPVRDDEGDNYSCSPKAGTSEESESLDISSENQAANSNSALVKDDEGDDYSCRPKAGTSEASQSLDISSEYRASYSSPIPVERDNFIAMNQEPKEPHDDDSASFCPLTIEGEQRSENENYSSNQDTSEGFECKRSHTEIYEAEAVSARTPHETPCSQKTKIKKGAEEYSNMAFSFDQDEASLLGTETGRPLFEARYQEQEKFPQLDRTPDDIACNNNARVSKRNPKALAWLNDPTLEVISF